MARSLENLDARVEVANQKHRKVQLFLYQWVYYLWICNSGMTELVFFYLFSCLTSRFFFFRRSSTIHIARVIPATSGLGEDIVVCRISIVCLRRRSFLDLAVTGGSGVTSSCSHVLSRHRDENRSRQLDTLTPKFCAHPARAIRRLR